MDRFVRPRLGALTHNAGVYAIALVCGLIAIAMPPMEVVPFTATGAGAALTAFGLAILVHDGVLALVAFAVTAVTLGSIGYHLLWR